MASAIAAMSTSSCWRAWRTEFEQVPDLFEAYNRAAPPAPLPDFLGALSTLVGFGMLTLA